MAKESHRYPRPFLGIGKLSALCRLVQRAHVSGSGLSTYRSGASTYRLYVATAIIVGAAPDSQEHNHWCGELVEQYPFVGGLVGSYTFENPHLTECLDSFAGKPWFVGIRTRPASPPAEWIDDPHAERGIATLQKRGLVLDMLMDHSLLTAVVPFAQKYSEMPIIINHCGLPPFQGGDLSPWRHNIHALANVPNIYMKYSSFFLHSHPISNRSLFHEAAHVLLESFGTTRLLWGSNWPPELVGGSYRAAYELMLCCLLRCPTEYSMLLSQNEIDDIYHNNALRVYGLSD